MKLFVKLWLSVAVLLGTMELSFAASSRVMDANKGILGEVEGALVEPLLKLTGKLIRAIEKDGKNMILSPISIHHALSMVLLGAEEGSPTETELINLLGHENGTAYTKLIELFDSITKEKKKAEKEKSRDRGAEIQMYNVVIEKDLEIKSAYVKQLNELFKSTMEKVTSEEDVGRISAKVNKWAKDAGFNSDLLTPDQFRADRFLMLVSAIKLQAYWFDEFGQDIRDDFFHNYGKIDQVAKNSVVLQNYGIENARYVEFTTKPIESNYRNFIENIKNVHSSTYKGLSNLEFRAIKIPMYGDVSFTIIEPMNSGSGKELDDLEKQLWHVEGKSNPKNFIEAMEIIDSLEANTRLEYLKMPGYQFETDIDLKQLLNSIGVTKIFTETAELSKIGTPKVHVDQVKHKAMIEVNKQGIKAAGATIIKLMPTSYMDHEVKIKVDIQNPYFFVLRYGKLPLFVGRLVHLKE